MVTAARTHVMAKAGAASIMLSNQLCHLLCLDALEHESLNSVEEHGVRCGRQVMLGPRQSGLTARPENLILERGIDVMKITRYLSMLILAGLMISALPMMSGFGQAVSMGATESSLSDAFETSYMDTPYRKAPLSILAYIQYTDLDDEYVNVRAAIDAQYGRTYQWDEFNDSSDLETLLPGHDVLLIMEQESAFRTNMSDVAAAWGSLLTEYVDAGGVVVLMDFFSLSGESDYAVTSMLYNETGLMSLYAYNDVTGANMTVTNSSSALARGVDALFTGANGAIAFQTDDGTPVVSYEADPSYHLVVDRIIGKGHVVLLGFDMFARSTPVDTLLANALRLPWHVVFDQSHSPNETVEYDLDAFAADLVTAGFAVSWITTLDPDYLATCDVLIIVYSDDNYTGSDITVLQDFVNEGKGLFITTEFTTLGDYTDELLASFGFERNHAGYLVDTDDYQGYTANVVYTGGNLINGSCTLTVTRVEMQGGTGFTSMPEEARSLIVTDTDNTTKWASTVGPGAIGVPVAASAIYGIGRVVAVGDTNFLSTIMDSDDDGTSNYQDSDNDVFLVNCIHWLMGAGVKERTILFDQSQGPYVSVSESFAALRMLTVNGFNVKWMTSFNTDLLDEVHVLIVQETATAHSTTDIDAIVAFVERGGGLLLWGDYGVFNSEISDVAERFGLIPDPGTYLDDTDDYLVYSSYLVYNGSNIQTHPITSGVSRIELDRSGGLLEIGSGVPLIVTDSDNTSIYSNGTAAPGVTVFAAVEHELGRVVYFSDFEFFSTTYDPDSDGWTDFRDSDNDLLTANTFWWLAENRAPVVTVTYPNGDEAVEDTVVITWDAIDPNLDELVFMVEYSPDGGTWSTLASGVVGHQYSWNTGSLDVRDCMIRVTASDYVLEGSDVSDAWFLVDNNAPVLTDVSHAPMSPSAGAPVVVSVHVTDVGSIALVECRYSIDDGLNWVTKTMTLADSNGYLTYDCSIGAFNASTTVVYSARATDAMGHVSDWTTEAQFTVPAPIDLMLLALIAGAAVLVLVIVVLMRKRGK